MGANPPSSPTRSQGGPKLSDISKRRESIVCSTDEGERRIVDRWGEKETPQDLLQEWVGSTRFRKSWRVLSEQTQPPAEDDFSPDVKGDILDGRPTSQQGKRRNFGDPKDPREILWLNRENRSKFVVGSGMCRLFCTVLYPEQIRQAGRTHKGTSESPNMTSRCVAKEYSTEPRPDLLSATSSGGSEARHLRSSVMQPERDSALGD